MAAKYGPVTALTPLRLLDEVYARLPERVALGRRRLGRPLTLAELEAEIASE